MHKLTNEQISAFRGKVSHYVSALGLLDWQIQVEVVDLGFDTLATTNCISDARMAMVSLNANWMDEPTNDHIERTAFHEVLEVLLWPLSDVARNEVLQPLARQQEITTQVHAVIRRLENMFMGHLIDR